MLTRRLIRIWNFLRTLPFLYPENAVICCATLSGLLLAFGSTFLLSMFDGDVRHSFGPRQRSGVLLLVAFLCASAMTWLSQRWEIELNEKAGPRPSVKTRLDHCRGREHAFMQGITWAIAWLALALIFLAVLVLMRMPAVQSSALEAEPCRLHPGL